MNDLNIYKNQFSEAFSALLSKSEVTCYQISQYTGIDQAYLSRLKNGEKCNPSIEVILKICFALTHYGPKVNLSDVEDLLNAVGRTITHC